MLKATEVISRRSQIENQANGNPFDRISWDLIPMDPGYNGDEWISHFQCTTTVFNMVYTHKRKSDSTAFMDKTLNLIQTQFGRNVRYIRLDGEKSLCNLFEEIISNRGIKAERTAPDTPAQNGGSERAGRMLITKARTMRIAAKLPANMWPEIIKTAGYISNRTPVKKLGWKTPFEAVKKKPRHIYLHVYGCKAYALIFYIPKKSKLNSKTHIGYLLGYDSTNIFRI
jgi:hypothetical protein